MSKQKRGVDSPGQPTARLRKPAVQERATGPKPARSRIKPVNAASIRAIFERFREADPAPQGELNHTSPFTLLVAVVLSAQSTDIGVNKATKGLFAEADTPQAMLALGEDGVKRHVKTLNFFNTKARNVVALSKRLVEEFGGEVPSSIEILESLPGVGRKTASVVANVAHRQPRIAVDTHIFRITNRIPLAITRTPLETQPVLEALVPEDFLLDAHHWLILHGRYVCKARKPECWRCLIGDLCRYEPKTPGPGLVTSRRA